ncbi:regulator of CtrA degradation [Sphingobium fontiphilum]|uniref:Regulator of CtrA degradation n=1 Tax=Sphingobium fontiphilum TaxID=944425 RepID=A0A7W6DK12_9SPHN|nr:DUF1465 family protein [Sphingobium fontiphilum]MBB3980489.1 regulator of CtrA degradation [Sphingobium fontiphilum]
MPASLRLDPGLHRRLVDSLYVEAMVMADEARSYFDSPEGGDGDLADPLRRIAFTCESLKVTTRLMHVIAWLLVQRACQRGEIEADVLRDEKYRLGQAQLSDAILTDGFPFAARSLIEASQELYSRVARLQDRLLRSDGDQGEDAPSPARALMDRLHTAF